MKENINVKEKRIDILGMWKDFWNPMPEEQTQEEEILGNINISEEDKKEMLKALKSAEKLGNSLFKNSYKTSRLKVDSEKSIKDTLKQKSNEKKIDEKVLNTSYREENDDRENTI